MITNVELSVYIINNMNQRQSNIELLRIVSMSFILILHFLQWAIGIESMNPYLFQTLTIFNICGVNLFVMISGYFNIKWSLNSFIRLTGMIIFFSLFCLLCGFFIFNMHISLIRIFKAIILPFTSTGYWFLQCYLGLYLIAPLLTKGLDNLSLTNLKQLIAVMTLVSIFSCWYGGNKLNADGYGIFHFIYLYILGYGIKHIEIPPLKCRNWILISLFCLGIDVLLSYGFDFYYNDSYNRYSWGAAKAYDNPFVICASVAIFMAFIKYDMGTYRIINSIAGCSLGCYLLQDGFLRGPIYSLQHEFMTTNPVYNTIIMFSFSFLSFWILSFIIYQIYLFSYNYLSTKLKDLIPVKKQSLA